MVVENATLQDQLTVERTFCSFCRHLPVHHACLPLLLTMRSLALLLLLYCYHFRILGLRTMRDITKFHRNVQDVSTTGINGVLTRLLHLLSTWRYILNKWKQPMAIFRTYDWSCFRTVEIINKLSNESILKCFSKCIFSCSLTHLKVHSRITIFIGNYKLWKFSAR